MDGQHLAFAHRHTERQVNQAGLNVHIIIASDRDVVEKLWEVTLFSFATSVKLVPAVISASGILQAQESCAGVNIFKERISTL
jgi:hypothetical protein